MSRSLVRRSLAVCALVALAIGSIGQAPPVPTPVPPVPVPPTPTTITMPATLSMTAGRIGRLCIDHNAKSIQYDVLSADVDTFREYDPTTGKVRLCLIYYPPQQFAGEKALPPLTFYVYAAGASGDAIVTGKTLVSVSIPAPPAPPVPPTPPAPPTPPVPTDPFAATLQATYSADQDPSKAGRDLLVALYRQAGTSTVNDPTLTTVGAFFAKFKAAVESVVPGLPNTKKALGAELVKVLPTAANAPLDAATRMVISTQYQRMATALEGVK